MTRSRSFGIRSRRRSHAIEPLEQRVLLSVELVKDIWPGERASDPNGLITFNNDKILFAATIFTDASRTRVWSSDGTSAGTVDLAGFDSGTYWQRSQQTPIANGKAMFQGNMGSSNAIWVTDGTVAGTTRLSVGGGNNNNPDVNSWSVALGNRFLFMGNTPQTGTEIFSSDGTDAGTFVVTDALPAPHVSIGSVIGTYNGLVFFNDTTSQSLSRLGVTDGTVAGTRIIADLNTGAGLVAPTNLTVANGVAYFQVPTAQGLKLWKSDGTAAGTGPLETTLSVVSGSMAELGGFLYFMGGAQTGNSGSAQLYRTDGTFAGTQLVSSSVQMSTAIGSRVKFLRVGNYIWMDVGSIWRTDGTAAGTQEALHGRTAGNFMFDGQRLWLENIDYVVDMADPTQTRATGLPFAGPSTPTLAKLGSYVYFPNAGELYRAALPTQYLANVDVRVFHDADGDGVEDAGEGAYPFASSVEVWVDLDNNGQVNTGEPTGLLKSDGTARLLGVPDGTFNVRVRDNAARFTTPNVISITVAGGQNPAPIVVGANRNNRVFGTVYDDQDGDATRDAGEPGIEGRRVYADVNGNLQFDAGEPFTLTDSSGGYKFETFPGETFLRAEVPTGWRATENPNGFKHSNFVGARDTTYGPVGQTTLPPPGRVTGQVFLDVDGDGAKGLAETQPGCVVTVFLDADDDGILDANEAKKLSGDGTFDFTTVQPGSYTVRVLPLAGWGPTGGAAPVVQVVSSVTTNIPLPLAPTSETGAISGVIFNDDDFDGVRDAGEPAVPGTAGAFAWLDLDNNNVYATSEPVAPADAFGVYRFPGLAAGSYRVGAFASGSHTAVAPRNPQVQTAVYDGVTPVSSASFAFAFTTRAARITGRVYRDINGNNAYDAGIDTPIPNVPVSTTGNAPPVLSGADGTYDLPTMAINQTLSVTAPAGWTVVAPASVFVQPTSLQFKLGPDFRLTTSTNAPLPVGVAGSVFFDVDADGVRDPAERGGGNSDVFGQVTPFVDLDHDGFLDTGEPTGNLGDRGEFVIGNLPAGATDVRLFTRAGASQTTPTGGAAQSFTLAAGQRGGPATFGVAFQPARASGEVYLDQNVNGMRDPIDAGAAGFAVRLDLDHDGIYGESGEPSATTNSAGQFTFTNLSPGTHYAALLVPANYQQVEPAAGTPLVFTVGPNGNVTGLLLGIARVGGAVSGKVFDDPNRDGVQGPNEGTLAGWTVRVENAQNASQFWTGTTNSQGMWAVNSLAAGSYRVVLVNISPDRSDVVTPPSGEYLVTLTTGQSVQSLNFGLAPKPYNATGFIFDDVNYNSQFDAGEPGRASVTVYHDLNDNRRLDAGEPTQLTGSDGRFTFTGLVPNTGTGKFRAVRPHHSLRSFPYGEVVDYMAPSSVVPGSTVDVGMMGFYTPTSHYMSGTAYLDVNVNGQRDAGEPPIEGRTLGFDYDQDGDLDTSDFYATTDAEGWYAFARFDPRDMYKIRDILPANWIGTQPINNGWQVVPGPGDAIEGIDFGSVPFSARGQLFHDRDNDGNRDAGEEGLAGRSVYVDLNDNHQPDAGEPVATTDAAGTYGLFVSSAGTYRVRQVVPAGWSQSFPLAGAAYQQSLAPGETVDNLDFGVADPAPQVTAVFVLGASSISGSTPWTSTFRDFLESSGAGESSYGYRVLAGAQTDELPWTNLTSLSIRFSEDVNIAADDLVLRGVSTPVYGLPGATAFVYDAATFTATWVFNTVGFAPEKLLIDLDGDAGTGVTDKQGNLLDGEWTNPVAPAVAGDTFPSGDGTPGGDFRFRLNILPGDVNRSGGSILGSDVTLVRNAQNFSPGTSGYSIFYDVNGSGSILGSDVTLVRNRQGLSMPVGEPIAPPSITQQVSIVPAFPLATPSELFKGLRPPTVLLTDLELMMGGKRPTR